MSFLLMLVDGDDNVALVACPTRSILESVGAKAVYGSGGVSAYPVLPTALVEWKRAADILAEGGNVKDIADAQLTAVPIVDLLEDRYHHGD